MLVIFTAPCDACGGDATWQQVGANDPVTPRDFTIRCPTCDPPPARG